jgi:hypothetical protein
MNMAHNEVAIHYRNKVTEADGKTDQSDSRVTEAVENAFSLAKVFIWQFLPGLHLQQGFKVNSVCGTLT